MKKPVKRTRGQIGAVKIVDDFLLSFVARNDLARWIGLAPPFFTPSSTSLKRTTCKAQLPVSGIP